jgi:hypothetical protein
VKQSNAKKVFFEAKLNIFEAKVNGSFEAIKRFSLRFALN